MVQSVRVDMKHLLYRQCRKDAVLSSIGGRLCGQPLPLSFGILQHHIFRYNFGSSHQELDLLCTFKFTELLFLLLCRFFNEIFVGLRLVNTTYVVVLHIVEVTFVFGKPCQVK